jgi:hypothetical protein
LEFEEEDEGKKDLCGSGYIWTYFPSIFAFSMKNFTIKVLR